MHATENRALNYAVLASVALHALLLFGFQNLPDPARHYVFPGPIVARLVEPPPAPEPAVEPIPVPRAERPKPNRIAKPAPKAPSATAPAPVAPLAEAAPLAPPSASPSPAPAPAPLAKAEPQAAVTAPSAEAADPGSLAQYRLQLISAARRYKQYPRVAMDNNWEGDVVVRMVIAANGMVASVSVKSSSGHEVLDQQALEMFKQAMPLVPIPRALRGREFAVELRAIYSLRDQDSG